MMDTKVISSSAFATVDSEEIRVTNSTKKPMSFWIDLVIKLISISFFILSLSQVLRAEERHIISSSSDKEIIINIQTDDFPQETSWRLINANTYESLLSSEGLALKANQLYSDTLLTQESTCLRFIIEDSKEDGLSDDGYYEVISDDISLIKESSFQASDDFSFGCSEGQICETPIKISNGTHVLTYTNNWFLIRPIFDTYYSVRTISDCDTKLWIYDDCKNVHPVDQSGTVAYNDDLDDKKAGFTQILLKGGGTYYLRAGEEEGCVMQSTLILTDLELVSGCMDPSSCNFNPLANLDSGDCIYADCHPDLIINQEVLSESLRLDTFQQNNECLIIEGCLQGYGKRDVIRFTTQIENIGDADYIVGEPEEDSDLFSEDNCHQHWHYLGYAEYLLFDGAGAPQPVGFKNGFCALDYRCDKESSYKYNCDYMGISAGCYDTYDSDYLCQWIDVTDVADGIYTLVVRVNHNRAKDIFNRSELDYENNWAQICVELDRSSGALEMHILESCPTYTDCLNIPFGNTELDCNGVCGGSDHFGDINGDGTTSQTDVDIYCQKMKDNDLPNEPCFDLDASQDISIYDLILLTECLKYNSTSEFDPLHTHCDFPKSIVNVSDTVEYRLSENSDMNSVLQVDYKSNVSLAAADFYISNVKIDSVVSLEEGVYIIDLSNGEHVMFFVKNDENMFAKSAVLQPFVNVFYSKNNELETCLFGDSEAVNSNKEKTITKYSGDCLDLITTPTSDLKDDDQMYLFPNPASEHLTLQVDGLQGRAFVKISDQFGRVVVHSDVNVSDLISFDIAPLGHGLYIVELYNQTSRWSSIFVKI